MWTAPCGLFRRGRLFVRRLRGAGRFRKRRKPMVRVFYPGLDDTRGNQERHRLFNRNVEIDHVGTGDIEEKAGGRVGRTRQKRRNMLGLRQMRCDGRARRLGEEDE